MAKVEIPPDISATEVREPDFYSLTCKPASDVLRKVGNILGGMGGNSVPPILQGDPFERIRQSSRIKELLENERVSPMKLDTQMRDLCAFIVYSGILIRSDTPEVRFVFDRDRCQALSKGEIIEVEKLELKARDDRLRTLLGLPVRVPHPKKEAAPGDIEATNVRRFTVDTARTRFNGLLDSYPELSDMALTLGLLAVHSAKGRTDGIVEATDNIARLVLALRDHIDSDAMAVIDDLTAKPTEPTADKTSFDPRSEIRGLQLARVDIDRIYQDLTRQKNVADERLEHLTVEILEQDLRQQLRFASDSDRPKLEAAVERAEHHARQLEEHIDALAVLMRPVKEMIDQIQRRLLALTIMTQPPPSAIFDTPTLPAMPTYDEDLLLDWRSIETSCKKATKLTPEEVPDGGLVDAEAAPGSVSTIELTEDFILAVFRLVGMKTAIRVLNALKRLGIITSQAQAGFFFTTCSENAKKDRPDRRLVYMGSSRGAAVYKPHQNLPEDIIDRVIPSELKERLRELLKRKPREDA